MLVGEFNQIGKVGCLGSVGWFAGQLIYSDRYAGYLGWIAGCLIY